MLAILQALKAQSFQSFNVLIGDDEWQRASPPPFIENDWEFGISYSINERNLGPLGNVQNLYSRCTAPYIKPIMADDLITPDFLEKMVFVLEKHPQISMAFSRRVLIDDNNNIVNKPRYYQYDTIESGIVSGRKLINDSIEVLDWFAGEPSAFVFRNKLVSAEDLFRSPTSSEAFTYHGSWDLSVYLKFLIKGDAYFINEPLTEIRQHPGRMLTHSVVSILCFLDYFHFCNDAYQANMLDKHLLYKMIEEVCRHMVHSLLQANDSDVINEPLSSNTVRFITYKLDNAPERIQTAWPFVLAYMHNVCKQIDFFGTHDSPPQILASALSATVETLLHKSSTDHLIKNNSDIYIYGAGEFANNILSSSSEIDRNVVAFIDSAPSKQGTTFREKPIIPLSQYRATPTNHIIIMSMFYAEIEGTLQNDNLHPFIDYSCVHYA